MQLDLCPECASICYKKGSCTYCGFGRIARPHTYFHPVELDKIKESRVWGAGESWQAGYTQPGPPTVKPRRVK